MIYRAYIDSKKLADFEADSLRELENQVIDFYLHRPEKPVPEFDKVCFVDEDDNETLLSAPAFNKVVQYELREGGY